MVFQGEGEAYEAFKTAVKTTKRTLAINLSLNDYQIYKFPLQVRNKGENFSRGFGIVLPFYLSIQLTLVKI